MKHDDTWYQQLIRKIIKVGDFSNVSDITDCQQILYSYANEFSFDADKKRKQFAMKASKYAKESAQYYAAKTGDAKMWELSVKLLFLEARYLLDSYCIYVEISRKPEEQFYMPRRRTLIKAVNLIQQLEDDDLDEIFIHQPPRTGKSQLITMATVWHACRNTELSNLYCTYKEDAGGAFLDGCKELITDPMYRHIQVFPQAKIVSTNAKENTVDLGRKKKYKSLSGKGLDSGLNGLYDASGWLIADDVLSGIEDVLSPDVLQRKQLLFDNNLMSRKKEKCKVIYNGTLWSVHDPYMVRREFLETNPAAKNIRWKILKLPALDENDESNFDYDYGVGFSSEYYRARRATFEANDDLTSWLCQYQQEPVERQGALFSPDSLKYYNGTLPNIEPLKVVAACDVALGGSDYLSMPIAYVYEDGSVYIHDVVFDNSEKKITQPKVVAKLIENNVTNAFFEANAGGEGYKDDIDRILSEKGQKINLVSKYAQQMILRAGKGSASKSATRKEQRIWDSAADIRSFYYRDNAHQTPEYRKFLNNLFSFKMTGNNKHDDAPDSLASLAVFLDKGSGTKTSQIVSSPI